MSLFACATCQGPARWLLTRFCGLPALLVLCRRCGGAAIRDLAEDGDCAAGVTP